MYIMPSEINYVCFSHYFPSQNQAYAKMLQHTDSPYFNLHAYFFTRRNHIHPHRCNTTWSSM